MTLSQHKTDDAFEFTLMRTRLIDATGTPVDGDGHDPEQWALADALSQAGAPLDLLPVGRGRMTVLSLDEREFVREKLVREPEPYAQFLRVLLVMHETAEREPAMGDLLAVLLPAGVAMVYEVVIASADLDFFPESSPGPQDQAFVSLVRGQAILRRGPDLPAVHLVADPEVAA